MGFVADGRCAVYVRWGGMAIGGISADLGVLVWLWLVRCDVMIYLLREMFTVYASYES